MKETIQYTWDTISWVENEEKDVQESCFNSWTIAGDFEPAQVMRLPRWVAFILGLAPNSLHIFMLHLSLPSPRHLLNADQIATSFSSGDVAENK